MKETEPAIIAQNLTDFAANSAFDPLAKGE